MLNSFTSKQQQTDSSGADDGTSDEMASLIYRMSQKPKNKKKTKNENQVGQKKCSGQQSMKAVSRCMYSRQYEQNSISCNTSINPGIFQVNRDQPVSSRSFPPPAPEEHFSGQMAQVL